MPRHRCLTLILALLLLLPLYGLAQAVDEGALQYLIASHEAVAQDGFKEFVVEYMPYKALRMRISLLKDGGKGEALRTWNISAPAMTPRVFRWDGRLGRELIPVGTYLLRFEPNGDTGKPREVGLEVLPPAPALPLSLTGEGDFLPLDPDDDASVWQTMVKPLAVVNIGAVEHMALRDRPGGRKVGEVHGQNAGVEVKRIEGSHALVGAYATDDGSYIEGYVPVNKLKMVTPQTRYGILVDKERQVMRVYERGKLLGELRISTGLMAKHRLLRETRAGAFLTGDRMLGFNSGGFRYDYALRIDGGNLIHQIGWKRVNGAPSFEEQFDSLDTKASTGCIRVQHEPSAEGLNAVWLWNHLPRATKVLILDDESARAERFAELFPTASPAPQLADLSDEGSLSEIEEPEPPFDFTPIRPPVVRAEPDTRIVLTFMGDCILGSEEKSRALPHSFDSVIAEKGLAWPFSGVQEILQEDDLSIINFEGVLKDDARGREDGKMHWFRGPTSFAGILPAGSIELAGLANNHVRDYGQAGRKSTKQALDEAGIPYFGYGDLYVYEKNGIRIGFGGIRETTWRQDRQRAPKEIEALRQQGCHYIIYTCHFGNEYMPINALQREIAYQLVDAGADLIIGTHPHIVQGIERYKQGLILYSLGNFSFGGNLELTAFEGLIAQVQLDFVQDALSLNTLRLIPVLTTGTKPANDFRPIPAGGEAKQAILTRIQKESNLRIAEEMYFEEAVPAE